MIVSLLLNVLFLGSWPHFAHADAHDLRVRALLRAHSVQQIEGDMRRLDSDNENERFCQAELRGERIPAHCLPLVRPVDRAMISRLCQRAVGHEDNLPEIRTILPLLQGDRDCFEAAKRRKQRLEYMHPEFLTEGFRNQGP